MKLLLSCLILLLISSKANAYIGPGLGLGLLGSILGLILSFFVLLFAILWFPLKRLFKKKDKKIKNQNK
jgi:hypothetical protein